MMAMATNINTTATRLPDTMNDAGISNNPKKTPNKGADKTPFACSGAATNRRTDNKIVNAVNS
jgi:hypothetical protein